MPLTGLVPIGCHATNAVWSSVRVQLQPHRQVALYNALGVVSYDACRHSWTNSKVNRSGGLEDSSTYLADANSSYVNAFNYSGEVVVMDYCTTVLIDLNN